MEGKLKIKVKVTYNRPPRTQRGSRGIAVLIFDLGARWGGGQHHAPAVLPLGKTRYPLYRWVTANILNKQSRTDDKRWYSRFGVRR
jgi:hypothetical protein